MPNFWCLLSCSTIYYITYSILTLCMFTRRQSGAGEVDGSGADASRRTAGGRSRRHGEHGAGNSIHSPCVNLRH